jgi:hypothetical protein
MYNFHLRWHFPIFLSKPRKATFPIISTRHRIRKTKYICEITKCIPLSENLVHFKPVELPIDSFVMKLESPCIIFHSSWCHSLVYHQELDLIIVILTGNIS